MHVLIALKDPSNGENMQTAEKLTRQQSERHKKKKGFLLPLEWLHTTKKHDIKSIDCLLHHDDLFKDIDIPPDSGKSRSIEYCLSKKDITQWEGKVKEIGSDWQGTITFEGCLPVRFVPLHVQPSMPLLGEMVNFCLSFDRFGLSAWRVMRVPEIKDTDSDSGDDDSSSQSSEYSDYEWQDGVSFMKPEMDFGFTKNADIEVKLFFHASQLMVPGNIVKDMLLGFKVEKLIKRTRAVDICVLKVRKCKLYHFSSDS